MWRVYKINGSSGFRQLYLHGKGRRRREENELERKMSQNVRLPDDLQISFTLLSRPLSLSLPFHKQCQPIFSFYLLSDIRWFYRTLGVQWLYPKVFYQPKFHSFRMVSSCRFPCQYVLSLFNTFRDTDISYQMSPSLSSSFFLPLSLDTIFYFPYQNRLWKRNSYDCYLIRKDSVGGNDDSGKCLTGNSKELCVCVVNQTLSLSRNFPLTINSVAVHCLTFSVLRKNSFEWENLGILIERLWK